MFVQQLFIFIITIISISISIIIIITITISGALAREARQRSTMGKKMK